ncbi:hypothetical protein H6F89_19825 [Cyanobacteria bacterium FACHB-63]|nr:hypothetical protein [Cyanobacteria bacterium FACHB-63]
MIPLITQQNLVQQLLANLQTVGVAVLGIILQLVHVASGESVLGLVQRLREIVVLASQI